MHDLSPELEVLFFRMKAIIGGRSGIPLQLEQVHEMFWI